MFISTVTLTHPTNVGVYDFDISPSAIQIKARMFAEWAAQNGLISSQVNKTGTSCVFTYTWSSQAQRDAMHTHFGPEYQNFLNQWTGYVTSLGCAVTRTEA